MNQQIKDFVIECVSHYAKCNKLDEFYSLDVHDLPDFVQHEFAALLITDNNDLASEATGPDNRHWETKMLPALTRHLKNSTDKDETIEFTNVWRACIADYMSNRMQELLDDYIDDFNSDHGYKFDAMKVYGVPIYGPL